MPIDFPYIPLRGAKKKTKWNVTEIGMGSGYSVTAAQGRTVTWDVQFSACDRTTKNELVGKFLQAEAVDTLQWTPPNHDQDEFVVAEWDMTPEGEENYLVSVSLRLIEVEVLGDSFEPQPL